MPGREISYLMKLREGYHPREPWKLLDTGFQGFHSVESRFQVLDSGILS